jgi:hypothetical protein
VVDADEFACIDGVLVVWVDLRGEADEVAGEDGVFAIGLLEEQLAAGEEQAGENLRAVVGIGLGGEDSLAELELGDDGLSVAGG